MCQKGPARADTDALLAVWNFQVSRPLWSEKLRGKLGWISWEPENDEAIRTWGEVVPAMLPDMFAPLGELCFPPLKILLSAPELFETGSFCRCNSLRCRRRVVERVRVERMGGSKGVLLIVTLINLSKRIKIRTTTYSWPSRGFRRRRCRECCERD